MNDKNYRQVGGVVDNILDVVNMIHERGFWEAIVSSFPDSTIRTM